MAQNISYPYIQHKGQLDLGVYPFRDNATMQAIQGAQIPPGVITDARTYIPGADPNQYISKITFSKDGITVYINDSSGVVATAKTKKRQSNTPLYDSYGREVGVLIGDILDLASAISGFGTITFDSTAMPFVSSVVVAQPSNIVTGIKDEKGGLISGDVWLVGEDGVALKYEAPNTISVNVIGDPLFKRKNCDAEVSTNQATSRPLKGITINGNIVYPDEFGNIYWIVGQGAGVSSNASHNTSHPGGSGNCTQVYDNIVRMIKVDNGIKIDIIGNYN